MHLWRIAVEAVTVARAVLLFDSPTAENLRTPVADNLLSRKTMGFINQLRLPFADFCLVNDKTRAVSSA